MAGPCAIQAGTRRRFRHVAGIWSRLPALLFAVAIALGALGYGWLAAERRWPPHGLFADGVKALRAAGDAPTVFRMGFLGFADIAAADAPAHRVRFLGGASTLGGPVLWSGLGSYWFRDLCPGAGCVAVAYDAAGAVAHAYPWRPREVARAWLADSGDDYPHEFRPGYAFTTDAHPTRVLPYPNGDVSVVFQHYTAYPYPLGVARLDRRGMPRWVRRDYSHHMGHLDPPGNLMIPALRLGEARMPVRLRRLRCGDESAYWSLINVIDADGRLVRSMALTRALLNSPFAGAINHTTNPCDPLHLNYVYRLGADAGGAWGIAPGDIVASLRNLSAFAIVDGATGRLKRLVRGSFQLQHSVTHYRAAKFLLFDNEGGGRQGPARVLMVDLADGRETTVFPTSATPARLRGLRSSVAGHIDISPDGRRALASFTRSAVAVEIALPSGEATAVFASLHDVTGLAAFSGPLAAQRDTHAAKSRLYNLSYIRAGGG